MYLEEEIKERESSDEAVAHRCFEFDVRNKCTRLVNDIDGSVWIKQSANEINDMVTKVDSVQTSW